MKTVLMAAALLPITALGAQAQAQKAAPATAPTTAASGATATLNGDSPIEAIAASPAGKASLTKNMPGLLDHPAYDQFKGMSLRALAPLSGGIITDEKIAAVEADMKTAK